MCCEHLICARCAQPVSDGSCAVCRAARADLHQPGVAFPASTLLASVVLLLTLAALLSTLLTR